MGRSVGSNNMQNMIQRNKIVFNNDIVDAKDIFSLAQLKGWLWTKYKNFGINFSLAEWLMCQTEPLAILHKW